MMKALSEESFIELLTACSTYPNYRGVIMLSDTVELEFFVNKFFGPHGVANLYETQQTDICRIDKSSTGALILYKNGSFIRMMLPLSSRGMRCNGALYSGNVSFDAVRSILSPMMRTYERARFDREYFCEWIDTHDDITNDTEDSSELDSFLSGFKVVPQCNIKKIICV